MSGIFSFKNLAFVSLSLLAACESKMAQPHEKFASVGKIERLDPSLNDIIDTGATIEVLASGFGWAEGPIWLPAEQKLLFTDVKQQMVYQWSEADSVQTYLDLADSDKNKPGPSALLVNKDKQLEILRYGHGQVVKMKSAMDHPSADFEIVADRYKGTRFNNTNDAAYFKNGDMIMSDPPPPDSSSAGKLGPGVYRINSKGVSLITDTMTSPNGIAFSPDYSKIYVSNADSKNAYWMVADVDNEGNISNGKKFFDATGYAPPEKGHPDGMRVNRNGIIFATGPGGIFIFSPEGRHLGTIQNDQFNTNCEFNDTQKTLYITAGQYLMRVVLKK